MSSKGKDSKKFEEVVETPTPPQIIDPSTLPGKGKNTDYKKEKETVKDENE